MFDVDGVVVVPFFGFDPASPSGVAERALGRFASLLATDGLVYRRFSLFFLFRASETYAVPHCSRGIAARLRLAGAVVVTVATSCE